jgi:2-aminoadipate transaminase
MRVDEVERILQRSSPKLIYVVSEFNNPKGTSLSLERRQRLLELSRCYGVPIVEDNPYGELRYTGAWRPSLTAMDNDGLVIYLSTFSKTLSPGLRIGWAIASEPVLRAMTTAKQAADLHTSTLLQHGVARLLETFDYDRHIAKIRSLYGERLNAMLGAMAQYFPQNIRWTSPEGGLFLWVELPEHVRAEAVLKHAIRHKVAFVPGAPFFVKPEKHHFLRLNFSNRSPELIATGIERLGRLLHSFC